MRKKIKLETPILCMVLFLNMGITANAKFGKPDKAGDRLSQSEPATYKSLTLKKKLCEDSATVLKRRVQIVGRDGKLSALSEIFDVTHVDHDSKTSPCYYEYGRISGISGSDIEVKIDSSKTRKLFDQIGSWTKGIIFVYNEKLEDWIAVDNNSSGNNFFYEDMVEDTTVPLRIYEPLLTIEGKDNAQMLSRVDESLTEVNRGFSSVGCSITISKSSGIHFGGRPPDVFEMEDPALPGVTLVVKKVASAVSVKSYQERVPNFYNKTISFDDVVARANLFETGALLRNLCNLENAQERELYRAHLRMLIKLYAIERRALIVEGESTDDKKSLPIAEQIKILDEKIYDLKVEELKGLQRVSYF